MDGVLVVQWSRDDDTYVSRSLLLRGKRVVRCRVTIRVYLGMMLLFVTKIVRETG